MSRRDEEDHRGRKNYLSNTKNKNEKTKTPSSQHQEEAEELKLWTPHRRRNPSSVPKKNTTRPASRTNSTKKWGGKMMALVIDATSTRKKGSKERRFLTVKTRKAVFKMSKKYDRWYCLGSSYDDHHTAWHDQYFDETHGINWLHLACVDGLTPVFISMLLDLGMIDVTAAEYRYGWVPLHFIVDILCRGYFSHLSEGMQVVRLLCAEDASMIQKSDNKSNTPLDIVHKAIISCNTRISNANSQCCAFQDCGASPISPTSTSSRMVEEDDLRQIYCELKQISIDVYIKSKRICEEGGERRPEMRHQPSSQRRGYEDFLSLDTLSTTALCGYCCDSRTTETEVHDHDHHGTRDCCCCHEDEDAFMEKKGSLCY